MARYGLEPIPDPAVDAALRDALGKVKGRLLVGVIGSIGVRRDPKAVPALAKRLGDPIPRSCRPPRGRWAGSARSRPSTPWRKPSRARPRPIGSPSARASSAVPMSSEPRASARRRGRSTSNSAMPRCLST